MGRSVRGKVGHLHNLHQPKAMQLPKIHANLASTRFRNPAATSAPFICSCHRRHQTAGHLVALAQCPHQRAGQRRHLRVRRAQQSHGEALHCIACTSRQPLPGPVYPSTCKSRTRACRICGPCHHAHIGLGNAVTRMTVRAAADIGGGVPGGAGGGAGRRSRVKAGGGGRRPVGLAAPRPPRCPAPCEWVLHSACCTGAKRQQCSASCGSVSLMTPSE